MSIADVREFFFTRIDWIKTIVCMAVMAVFCFQGYTLAYVDIPEHNRDVFIHYLGITDGAVIAIVGYYYGSSKSSQKKDETIRAQAENK